MSNWVITTYMKDMRLCQGCCCRIKTTISSKWSELGVPLIISNKKNTLNIYNTITNNIIKVLKLKR
jgi:hypothetical protein